LFIFIACLTPGKEIPDVHIPLIDKWVHLVLFGVFALLWLCSYPSLRIKSLLMTFIAAAFMAWLTETLQGMFPSLQRTKDVVDMMADGVGAIMGILIFYGFASKAAKRIYK
jgi:VanZ family protein